MRFRKNAALIIFHVPDKAEVHAAGASNDFAQFVDVRLVLVALEPGGDIDPHSAYYNDRFASIIDARLPGYFAWMNPSWRHLEPDVCQGVLARLWR